MKKDAWETLFHSVIEYIRLNHEREIDEAYDYFWEEEDPEEFIGGTALAIGFHNFEDWMASDFTSRQTGKAFIDSYIESQKPSDENKVALNKTKDSFISLYEVKTIGNSVTLHNIATDEDISIDDERLKALSVGDMFGARVLDLGHGPFLTKAIYPFGNKYKEHVMKHLDAMYNRYAKHCKDKACMEDFLRQETYTINTVWVTCLYKAK